jgi:hypothetical protein
MRRPKPVDELPRQARAAFSGARPVAETTAEPFRTIKEASLALGVPPYSLRRAAKAGVFPVYRPFSSRWVVRLSEIEAAIEASRVGRIGE